MSKRKIETTPSPILRLVAKEIEKIDKRVNNLVKDMEDTLEASEGIGIAAPQIGESTRIILIELRGGKRKNGEEMPKFPLTVMINPEITSCSKDTEKGDEGCLSVPDIWGEVERSKKIALRYLDIKGTKHQLDAVGLLARVIQHEVDHLDGIIFTDKVDYKTLHKIGPDGEKIPFEI